MCGDQFGPEVVGQDGRIFKGYSTMILILKHPY